jgi:hypothetical protein
MTSADRAIPRPSDRFECVVRVNGETDWSRCGRTAKSAAKAAHEAAQADRWEWDVSRAIYSALDVRRMSPASTGWGSTSGKVSVELRKLP